MYLITCGLWSYEIFRIGTYYNWGLGSFENLGFVSLMSYGVSSSSLGIWGFGSFDNRGKGSFEHLG